MKSLVAWAAAGIVVLGFAGAAQAQSCGYGRGGFGHGPTITYSTPSYGVTYSSGWGYSGSHASSSYGIGRGHYDYVPGHYDRHRGHYDYVPPHVDYHRGGHSPFRHRD